MIIGVGCDIVSNNRIYSIHKKYGYDFAKRILGSEEMKIYNNISDQKKISYLAKRFAAKEAVAKSLRSGIRNGLNFRDVEILNDDLGAPLVKIKNINEYNIHVSISDEKDYSVAFVILTLK